MGVVSRGAWGVVSLNDPIVTHLVHAQLNLHQLASTAARGVWGCGSDWRRGWMSGDGRSSEELEDEMGKCGLGWWVRGGQRVWPGAGDGRADGGLHLFP